MKKGILLINLGSPKQPEIPAIRKYLREFLMDPLVLQMPWPLRAMLVYGVILPFRPQKTLKNYLSIWTTEGSPLIVESKKLQSKFAKSVSGKYQVEMAMRYGDPSIQAALESFHKNNVSNIRVIPLYPQYALSTGMTTELYLNTLNKSDFNQFFNFSCVIDFFNHPSFIKALSIHAKEALEKLDYDHLLISFHGLPKSHLGEKVQSNICKFNDCCAEFSEKNRYCYRAQCFETARLLTKELGLAKEKWSVSFQSRLTKGWIEPFTDVVIEQMPARGIKKLAVICPSFVTDCLETLEEVNIGERARFLKAGGENFTYISCLNDSDNWIKTLQILGES